LPRKRRVRRVKYEPVLVAQRVLNNPLYLAITRILLEKNIALQAGDIRREMLRQRIDITTGYISNILRKLEKWYIVRPYKNPYNGKLLWTIRESSKAVEVISEELRKQEAKVIIETWGIS